MRELGSWLEWPHGIVRVGVVLVVAVAAVAALLRYPWFLRDLDQRADANSALSYADREIAGGNGLVADQTAVYAARALIPEDETFNVVVASSFEAGTDETVRHVAGYYRYFLMPRRMAESAQWVICYACDRAEYGAGARVVWEGSDDISILRIRR